MKPLVSRPSRCRGIKSRDILLDHVKTGSNTEEDHEVSVLAVQKSRRGLVDSLNTLFESMVTSVSYQIHFQITFSPLPILKTFNQPISYTSRIAHVCRQAQQLRHAYTNPQQQKFIIAYIPLLPGGLTIPDPLHHPLPPHKSPYFSSPSYSSGKSPASTSDHRAPFSTESPLRSARSPHR